MSNNEGAAVKAPHWAFQKTSETEKL